MFRSYKINGFCDQSIQLYSDSTFYVENGCEGRSNFSSGDFKKVVDIDVALHKLESMKNKVDYVKTLTSTVDEKKTASNRCCSSLVFT